MDDVSFKKTEGKAPFAFVTFKDEESIQFTIEIMDGVRCFSAGFLPTKLFRSPQTLFLVAGAVPPSDIVQAAAEHGAGTSVFLRQLLIY